MATYRHFRGPYGDLTPLVAYKGGVTRISEFHPALVIQVETTVSDLIVLVPLRTNVNVRIDWGDGSPIEDFTTDDPTHTYAGAGTFTIGVTGSASVLGKPLSLIPATWRSRVRAITLWGELGVSSYDGLFNSMPSTPVVTVPNYLPSEITNIREMFKGYSTFNQPIGNWDTSNVTTMFNTFSDAHQFNQPIGNWNTSNVTTMYQTFDDARAFNQDISGWDVSKVSVMTRTFRDAQVFNQPIGSWNAKSFYFETFSGALAFNQDISGWDYITGMFNSTGLDNILLNATAFSPANYGLLLAKWASGIPTIRSDLRPTVSSKYPSSAAADRAALVDYGWTISDLGQL